MSSMPIPSPAARGRDHHRNRGRKTAVGRISAAKAMKCATLSRWEPLLCGRLWGVSVSQQMSAPKPKVATNANIEIASGCRGRLPGVDKRVISVQFPFVGAVSPLMCQKDRAKLGRDGCKSVQPRSFELSEIIACEFEIMGVKANDHVAHFRAFDPMFPRVRRCILRGLPFFRLRGLNQSLNLLALTQGKQHDQTPQCC